MTAEPDTPPLLTIAIPTYNRAPRLGQCLSMLAERMSELPALRPAIEVLVIDNASSDDTGAVAAAQAPAFEDFRYVRNQTNLGIDGNIHRCSQLASGSWVQLLSDDDLLLPGALVRVVETINSHPAADFVFLNMIAFREDLPPPSAWVPRIAIARDLICVDQNRLVETAGVWLTFLSSFVFRRDAWNRSTRLESYIGTDIYLSFALFDLLSQARESVVLAEPLVASRAHFSGNYRIFRAFGREWSRLLLARAPAIGFDRSRMRLLLRRTIRSDLLERVVYYRLDNGSLGTEDRENIACALAAGPSPVTVLLWLSMRLPRPALVGAFKTARQVRRWLRS